MFIIAEPANALSPHHYFCPAIRSGILSAQDKASTTLFSSDAEREWFARNQRACLEQVPSLSRVLALPAGAPDRLSMHRFKGLLERALAQLEAPSKLPSQRQKSFLRTFLRKQPVQRDALYYHLRAVSKTTGEVIADQVRALADPSFVEDVYLDPRQALLNRLAHRTTVENMATEIRLRFPASVQAIEELMEHNVHRFAISSPFAYGTGFTHVLNFGGVNAYEKLLAALSLPVKIIENTVSRSDWGKFSIADLERRSREPFALAYFLSMLDLSTMGHVNNVIMCGLRSRLDYDHQHFSYSYHSGVAPRLFIRSSTFQRILEAICEAPNLYDSERRGCPFHAHRTIAHLATLFKKYGRDVYWPWTLKWWAREQRTPVVPNPFDGW